MIKKVYKLKGFRDFLKTLNLTADVYDARCKFYTVNGIYILAERISSKCNLSQEEIFCELINKYTIKFYKIAPIV